MSLSNRHCRIGHLSHKNHLILYVCILPIVNIYCRQREKRDVLALKLVIYFLFSVLRQGGTGFAASGVDLNAKEARPVMQVWCDKQTFGLPSIVARFFCFIFICLGFLWLSVTYAIIFFPLFRSPLFFAGIFSLFSFKKYSWHSLSSSLLYTLCFAIHVK